MASREVVMVYQDCPLCGDRGKRIKEVLKKSRGIRFKKVSFATTEGREYCAQSIEKGIKRMPFFVDGDRYCQTLEEVLGAGEKKAEKKTEKRKRKAVANEVDGQN